MTEKTPERKRRDAAREFAEQLAVVVTECTWEPALSWLRIHKRDAPFSDEELILVLASMTPADEAYRATIAERTYPAVQH